LSCMIGTFEVHSLTLMVLSLSESAAVGEHPRYLPP
jgi:hypothetical protein